MKKGVNKVIILGNIGSDLNFKDIQSGSVVNFSVATSENWLDKQGNRQEKTEWHKIVAFGKLAEILNQYASKGDKIYIEGKLQTRAWQDSQGVKKYTTEILANEAQIVSNKQEGSADSQAKKPREPIKQERGVIDFDDDVPF